MISNGGPRFLRGRAQNPDDLKLTRISAYRKALQQATARVKTIPPDKTLVSPPEANTRASHDPNWELAFERATLSLPETEKLTLRKEVEAQAPYGPQIKTQEFWEAVTIQAKEATLENYQDLVRTEVTKTSDTPQKDSTRIVVPTVAQTTASVKVGILQPQTLEEVFAWGDQMETLVGGWGSQTRAMLGESTAKLAPSYTKSRQFWTQLSQSLPKGVRPSRNYVELAVSSSVNALKNAQAQSGPARVTPSTAQEPSMLEARKWHTVKASYRPAAGAPTVKPNAKDFGVPASRAKVAGKNPVQNNAKSQAQSLETSSGLPGQTPKNGEGNLPVVTINPGSDKHAFNEVYADQGAYRKRAMSNGTLPGEPERVGAQGVNQNPSQQPLKHQRSEARYEQDKQVVMRKESSGPIGGGGRNTSPQVNHQRLNFDMILDEVIKGED